MNIVESSGINYKVNDIIPSDLDNLKVIFLFESPFKEEVKNGCPIAGRSGKAVTKKLNNILPEITLGIPFGLWQKQNNDERFAVMNCSNYPLDRSAYDSISSVDLDIKTFDRIRLVFSRTEKGRFKDDEQKVIYNFQKDLERRINEIIYSNPNKLLIVLCGKFAQNFSKAIWVKLKNDNLKNNYDIIKVPHPSRNQWSHAKYENIIQQMLNNISDLLGLKSEEPPKLRYV